MNDHREIETLRARASLFELASMGLRIPDATLLGALGSGEYADAIEEYGTACGCDGNAIAEIKALLEPYAGMMNEEALLRDLRVEYTSLLVGAPEPLVSPYAGFWHAKRTGVEPLFFVNPRSADIRRFMSSCGVTHAEGDNTPLDHIGIICEFESYLCLVAAGDVDAPEGASIERGAIEAFERAYVSDWIGEFAESLGTMTEAPFYKAMARIAALVFAPAE